MPIGPPADLSEVLALIQTATMLAALALGTCAYRAWLEIRVHADQRQAQDQAQSAQQTLNLFLQGRVEEDDTDEAVEGDPKA